MFITKKGDTIIEVMLAITIFCIVSVLSISLMNSGVSSAQASLELTMARNEIDAQAEALRFIHNSYLAERNLARNGGYEDLWGALALDNAIDSLDMASFPPASCDLPYGDPTDPATADESLYIDHAYIINYRDIDPYNPNETIIAAGGHIDDDTFRTTPLYPRIIFGTEEDDNSEINLSDSDGYNQIFAVEGIWVIASKSAAQTHGQPEFFDFHIRTCWYAPGHSVPTTIGTIVRLYNPDVIE
jgi:type II secretory pathway pseudopilin PulG